jgi:hypothetical protein
MCSPRVRGKPTLEQVTRNLGSLQTQVVNDKGRYHSRTGLTGIRPIAGLQYRYKPISCPLFEEHFLLRHLRTPYFNTDHPTGHWQGRQRLCEIRGAAR